MKDTAISLMYHDVVECDGHEASGFPWPDAALYKLDPKLFDEHLQAIVHSVERKPSLVSELKTVLGGAVSAVESSPWMLTFDDGGVSAYTRIAPKLEEIGWRGHFFITAGYIGRNAFVNPAQIRELRDRGHLIGAHSFSHPLRMASCGWDEILREWTMSVEILSDILGERVSLASVPGGQYAKKVARAASVAGIETLFTSEPTVRSQIVENCRVFGRYSIQRRTPPEGAAALAKGKFAPRFKQSVFWNAKKLIKAGGGEYYLKIRKALTEMT